MKRDPLSAYRKGGIKDDHIVLARRILFFYVLFLAYQIFLFPYSLVKVDPALFYVDIVFQSGLLILLGRAYSQLRQAVSTRWEGEVEKQEAVMKWLTTSLVGMNVKPGQLRTLALSVFTGSFAPAFIIALPRTLDGLVSLNEIVIENLRAG